LLLLVLLINWWF